MDTISSLQSNPQRSVAPRPIPQRLRDELGSIADRYEAAREAERRAATIEDRELAEEARRDAVGQYWAASRDLAELPLLLLRHALQSRSEELAMYLAEALRPELTPLAEAIAVLERRIARLEARRR
jgi:hypothetical protein